jgi:hypothetical protein
VARKARAGDPPKGPWPAPVVDALERVAAKYAAHWPAWGHRKIHQMMAADRHTASRSSVERALRRRDLLQPVDYQGERRSSPRPDGPRSPRRRTGRACTSVTIPDPKDVVRRGYDAVSVRAGCSG